MDSGTTEAPTEAPPSSPSPPPSKSPPTSSAPPADDISSPPPPPPADDSSPPPPVTSNTAAPSPRSLGHTPKSPSSGSSSGTSSGSSSGTSSGSSSNSSSKHNHMHDLIIPVVVGALIGIGVLLLVGMFVYLCTRKKRKSSIEDGRYHKGQVSEPRGKVGGDYYKTPPAQHSPAKWQYPSPRGDHRGTFSPVARVGSPLGMKAQPFLPASEEPSVYSGSHGTNSALPSALPSPRPPRAFGSSKPSFTYEELAAATGGFVEANLIGQGGFGYVHKGVLPNGKEIAVKSLKKGSGQGDREFQAEVEIISRVHHRHLVSLVGYSISGGQRLLVYEFIPNNTLEFHLHGKGNPPMDWHTRLKIARGAAKGFAYLHEDCHPRIIHRDIKAANILLDFNFDAKVADFGLAKLTSDNNTHVSTRVMGTFGYLAPEYASSGKLTEKSDVFSYGVMLLELISGRRPVDVNGDMEDSLVDWARPLCTKALETGKFDELVDPFMEGNYNPQEMARMVACAAAAVRHSSKRRPKMSQIVRGLEGDMSLDNLKEWVKGVGQHSTLSGSTSASTLCGSPDMENSNIYSLDMRQIRKTALESIECTSPSSGSAKTSEYGLDTPSSNSEEMRKNKNGNHGRTPSSSSGEVTPKVPSRNPDV